MKSNRKQREKELDKTKTKPPHSIGVPGSSKVLNVSKRSQLIQKKPDKTANQSKLVAVKNENGTKSLTVSKANASTSVHRTQVTRSAKSVSTVPKPTVKVESKVSAKSPIYLCLFSNYYCYLNVTQNVCIIFNFRKMKKKLCLN